MEKRKVQKVELFLENFNIEWHTTFGYVMDFDGEIGKPCSVEFIDSLERFMYKYNNKQVIASGDKYYPPTTFLEAIQEIGQIFTNQ